VQNQREARQQLADFIESFKIQLRFTLELKGAMAGSDGYRQRITSGTLNKFNGFIRIGKSGVAISNIYGVFNAGQFTQFSRIKFALYFKLK